jgi:hypothetical protein
MVGAFATQEEALAWVCDVVRRHNETYASWYLLGRRDPDRRFTPLIEGYPLVRLAVRTASSCAPGGDKPR